MSTLQIWFELREISDIEPFTGEGGPHLSWFGLTDSHYDLVVGEQGLFSGRERRGIDYYASRLWEDLILLAWYALDEVPPPLASRLHDLDAWIAWSNAAFEADGIELDLVEQACHWWWDRKMDTGHLRGAPTLYAWRARDTVHLAWRSMPSSTPADARRWASPNGEASFSADAFGDAVTAFDRDLVAAMEQRVVSIEQGRQHPRAAIDRKLLRREQHERAVELERRMSMPLLRDHSWEEVLAAVDELEQVVGPVVPA